MSAQADSKFPAGADQLTAPAFFRATTKNKNHENTKTRQKTRKTTKNMVFVLYFCRFSRIVNLRLFYVQQGW